MSDFADMSYGTVHGRFLAGVLDSADAAAAPDAEPLAGWVTFSATASTILVGGSAPPATLFPLEVRVALDSQGYLAHEGSRDISLWATDDQSGNPYDWQWHVHFALTHRGRSVYRAPFNFALPSGTVVDLTTVAPASIPSPGTIIIQGPPGEDGVDGVDAFTPSITAFTTPGSHTWTKPAGAKLIQIIVIGGGGGGKGGSQQSAAAAATQGGHGGGGGGRSEFIFPAAGFPDTLPVTVGGGGTGGAGATVAGAGVNGNPGTPSTVGTSGTAFYLVAFQGNGGSTSGGPGGGGRFSGSQGATASATGNPGAGPIPAWTGAGAGGGYGGGIAAGTDQGWDGSDGGPSGTAGLQGGKGNNTALNTGASAPAGTPVTGGAGGGGSAYTGPGGQPGGNGGLYGSAGGGGAASKVGNPAGKGGNGASGIVVIMAW